MNIETPDFSGLNERLLSPHRFVELVPGELVDNGYAVRLIPARNGKKLNCEHIDPATLPTLDLAQAGIETDRRPQTILAEVEKLLRGQRFAIEPDFNFPAVMAILPKIGAIFGMKLFVLELQASNWLFTPANFNPERDIDKLFKDFSQISFSIVADGEPIKGLGIEKSVQGFMGTIADFLMPWGSLDKDSAEAKALRAAMDFYLATSEVKVAEDDYEKYIVENGKKWWFSLFNKKKKWERRIAACKEVVASTLSKANETLAALPA